MLLQDHKLGTCILQIAAAGPHIEQVHPAGGLVLVEMQEHMLGTSILLEGW